MVFSAANQGADVIYGVWSRIPNGQFFKVRSVRDAKEVTSCGIDSQCSGCGVVL